MEAPIVGGVAALTLAAMGSGSEFIHFQFWYFSPNAPNEYPRFSIVRSALT